MQKLSEVENEVAIEFLMRNKAYKEQISISKADKWMAALEEGKIIGIIGMLNFKNKSRIKAFYVIPEKRNHGIGEKLLESILQKEMTTSAFATEQSKPLFEKHGFRVVSENKNNICFMERRSDNV